MKHVIRRSSKLVSRIKRNFSGRSGQTRSVSKPQKTYPLEVTSMLRDKNLNQQVVKNINPSSVFAYQTPFWRIEFHNGQIWDVAENKKFAMKVATEKVMLNLDEDPLLCIYS